MSATSALTREQSHFQSKEIQKGCLIALVVAGYGVGIFGVVGFFEVLKIGSTASIAMMGSGFLVGVVSSVLLVIKHSKKTDEKGAASLQATVASSKVTPRAIEPRAVTSVNPVAVVTKTPLYLKVAIDDPALQLICFIHAEDTIRTLKERIASETNLRADRLNLQWNSRYLSDESLTLKEYEVDESGTIEVTRSRQNCLKFVSHEKTFVLEDLQWHYSIRKIKELVGLSYAPSYLPGQIKLIHKNRELDNEDTLYNREVSNEDQVDVVLETHLEIVYNKEKYPFKIFSTETIGEIKQRVKEAMGIEPEWYHFETSEGKLLRDSENLMNAGIKNNAELNLVME